MDFRAMRLFHFNFTPFPLRFPFQYPHPHPYHFRLARTLANAPVVCIGTCSIVIECYVRWKRELRHRADEVNLLSGGWLDNHPILFIILLSDAPVSHAGACLSALVNFIVFTYKTGLVDAQSSGLLS
jgi:hypothetical protein